MPCDRSSSDKRARHQLGASSARAAAALCHLLPGDGGPPPFVAHTLWTASSGRRCRLCGRGCQLFGVRARCETIEAARRGDAAALEARLAARPVCRGGDAGVIVCAIAASRHVPVALLDVVHAAYPTAACDNVNALVAAGWSHRVDMAAWLCDHGNDVSRVSFKGVLVCLALVRARCTDVVLACLGRVSLKSPVPYSIHTYQLLCALHQAPQPRVFAACIECNLIPCSERLPLVAEHVLRTAFHRDASHDDRMALLRLYFARGGTLNRFATLPVRLVLERGDAEALQLVLEHGMSLPRHGLLRHLNVSDEILRVLQAWTRDAT